MNHLGVILLWTSWGNGGGEGIEEWTYTTIFSTVVCSFNFIPATPNPEPSRPLFCCSIVSMFWADVRFANISLSVISPVPWLPKSHENPWPAIIPYALHSFLPSLLSFRRGLGRAEREKSMFSLPCESEGPICLFALIENWHPLSL